jgi:hypothetical protein
VSLSAAIDDSLAALAERDEGREPVDLAAEVLLRMCGKALDMTMAQSNPYAVAQLAGRILELLRDLRMTPASRGALNTDGDPLDEIRHLLSSPEVRDPEEP